MQLDSPITAMVMEDGNGEGMFGTRSGDIYYVDMAARAPIRIVSRLAAGFEKISYAKFDSSSQHVFLSTCGVNSGDVKLMTSKTIDLIHTFPQYAFGPIAFIAASKSRKSDKRRIIGHKNGVIRFISVDTLKVDYVVDVELE